jgi:hypothetical protein
MESVPVILHPTHQTQYLQEVDRYPPFAERPFTRWERLAFEALQEETANGEAI